MANDFACNNWHVLWVNPEQTKIDASGLHPTAGRNRPTDAGVCQPCEQLARTRQRAHGIRVAAVGLGMAPL
jgi:hypothetical protein